MKKIANITQTYQTNAQFATGTDGKDREFLIDFLIKDKSQLKLREKLDLHTFTFHNYDEQKAKIIFNKIKKVLPNTKSLIYNNMTLGNSLKLHLQFLKERKITDVLWIQDDEFSLVDEQDLLDFLDFYKNEKQIENVALARDCKYINDCEQKEKIKINENLFLYKTECKHFEESKNYAMDFSTFMCSIDFLIDVFSSIDVNHTDAYKLEGEFSNYFFKKNIQRCVLNKKMFKTYNIVGMVHSIGDADKNLNELNIRLNT